MAAALRVLSIAVASGRAGYVFIVDGQLFDWGITVKATSNPTELAGFAQGMITALQPDVVVTEKCDRDSRKGTRSRALIKAITETASHNCLYDVSVVRPRDYVSKYEEASALSERYPEVAGYLPLRKRRIFDFEPRSMIIFEALSLAEAMLNGPNGSVGGVKR